MKPISLLLGVATLALPLGTTHAQSLSGQSMTDPHLSVDRWITRIGLKMENRMAMDGGLPHRIVRPLMAQVSFKCSQSGRPSAVTLVAPSGSPQFDAVAVRTVAAIPSLHPLPRDISYDQRYRAVLFYSSDSDAPMVNAKALAIRNQGNAWLHRHPSVIVGSAAMMVEPD
jgi:hypothetical protein